MVKFGVSVLMGISGNKHKSHLYDQLRRDHLLRSIIDRLPTNVQREFFIDKYTIEYGRTYPCISRSDQVRVPTVLLLFTPVLLLFTLA